METLDIKGFHSSPLSNPVQDLLSLNQTQKTFPNSHPNNDLSNHNQVYCHDHHQSQNTDSSINFLNKFLPTSPYHYIPLHVLSPNLSTSLNNDATLDGEREHQMRITDEKRLRRMISNRESARRSRMRKKKQIEELQSQVDQLQSVNNHLSEKLIYLFENQHQLLQENANLKEKVSSLQKVISDVLNPLRSMEEITCAGNYFKGEASNQSTH